MAKRSRQAARIVGFSLSLLCSIVNCITLSFNVYAVPLKEIFNFTQTEVELVASSNTAGLAMAIIGTILLSLVGYKIMFAVIFLTTVPGYALLWLSVVYSDFFRNWPSLLCLFHFITSSGNEMAFNTFLEIGTGNFQKENVGKVTGLYLAAFGLGKIFYASLYECFFQENQDLHLFFLTIVVINSITLPACFVFHRPHATSERSEEISLIDQKTERDITIMSEKDGNGTISDNNKSVGEMFKSLYFILIFCPGALLFTCAFTFMNNVTTLAKSVNVEQPLNLVYVISTSLVAVRILLGAIYDFFRTVACGFYLNFICHFSFMAAMVIGIFTLNSTTVYVCTILCGISLGGAQLLPVIMLSVEYGVQRLALISGIFVLSVALLTPLVQAAVGLLYDKAKFHQTSGDVFCRGNTCFLWTFALLLCLTAFTTICGLINFINMIFYRPTRVPIS